jgi:hypothetical protein
MTRWMRAASLGTVVLAGAAATLVVAGGSGASAAPAARTKVTYKVSSVQVKVVGGGAAPALGSQRSTSGALTAGTSKASFAVDCKVVRVTGSGESRLASSLCDAVIITDKGQIAAQGIGVGSLAPKFPITGGTGAYEGARGSLAITTKGSASYLTLDYTR